MAAEDNCSRECLQRATTTAVASGRALEPFDCSIDFQRWVVSWSLSKVRWCCRHQPRWCPVLASHSRAVQRFRDVSPVDDEDYEALWATATPSSPSPRTSMPSSVRATSTLPLQGEKRTSSTTRERHHCNGAESNGSAWPLKEVMRCCIHHGLGCSHMATRTTTTTTNTTTTSVTTLTSYDCEDGLEEWWTRWSDVKATWCCQYHSKGCSATETGDVEEPYDCVVPAPQGQKARSAAEAAWCCRNHGIGCTTTKEPPAEPFDCAMGLPHWKSEWSEVKKDWCCRQYGLGCAEGNVTYNCVAGFANWRDRWQREQQRFCCRKFGRACEEQPLGLLRGFERGVGRGGAAPGAAPGLRALPDGEEAAAFLSLAAAAAAAGPGCGARQGRLTRAGVDSPAARLLWLLPGPEPPRYLLVETTDKEGGWLSDGPLE